MTAILALDLGTTTGWALFSPPEATLSGVWNNVAVKRESGGGMRYVTFEKNLAALHYVTPIGQVYFEEVRRHAATQAAHVYGGFKATLMAWCEKNNIPYESVPVGAIKKSWTGNGAASKEMMIAEARSRGYEVVFDDEADALAILDLKLKEMRDAPRGPSQ